MPLKELHQQYGDRIRFFDVFIHQAHPGGERHRYTGFDEKLAGAKEYRELEQLPWPVLVDDLAGTVHEALSPTIEVTAACTAAAWPTPRS